MTGSIGFVSYDEKAGGIDILGGALAGAGGDSATKGNLAAVD
jgi:hypothetical protein